MQLILPRLKLSLVIWQKESCSIRDDLWKATTVLLNFGQKNDKNPSHATTTWTATDGDTGDRRGKPGWAVLNNVLTKQRDVKEGKAPASFQSLSTWRTGPQTVLCMQGAQSSNCWCHALERNSENLRRFRFDQEFPHTIWTFANLGLLRKQLVIEPSCKPNSQR